MNLRHIIPCLLLILAICSAPATAVIAEYTVTGFVEDVRPSENMMIFSADSTVGMEYENGSHRMVYEPLEPTIMLEFSLPDPAAFEIVDVGETAAATLLGDMNGTCIAIGRLQETPEGELVITSLVGDPLTMPIVLVGGYCLTYVAEPDCANVTGTTAPALAVNTTLYSEGVSVFEKRLFPGESFTWNGRNDGSAVNTTFISGEASSSSCPGYGAMVGPQPVSTFIITATPPVGLVLSDPGPAAISPEEIPSATQAAPVLMGLATISALAGALLILRRL